MLWRLPMRWKMVLVAVAAAFVLGGRLMTVRLSAFDLPSGERQLGQVVLEPAYDDRTGTITYLSTPIGAPIPSKSNWHAVSPLYIVVYPKAVASIVGTMNCAHLPEDNCADHGPETSMDAA